MKRLSAFAVVALVLLRLLTGWHFYNEGVKKLDGFSSAGFLRTSKGPFAPLFRSMVKGPHGAYGLLATPTELDTRDADTQAALNGWRADYGKRAAAAVKTSEPFPDDINPAAPGAEWVENIAESWNAGLVRLDRLGVDEEARGKIEAVRDAKIGQIVEYLHTEGPAIEDLRHEAWRLEGLREDARGQSPAPFQRELIEDKEIEIWRTLQPWPKTVQQIEESFISEAASIASEAGVSEGRTKSALTERSMLGWIDLAVTYTVLGCGICIFLGLGVRIAGVIAAGFLLSLILTQPPWVPGADLAVFFTWAIELAAFLVLAAIGAGQWAGIDGLIHAMRVRFGDLSPTYAALRPKAAPATDA